MKTVRLITVMAANGLTVIRKTAGAIAAWSNGVSKEELIGVGFGSIGKNSCSDEKKNRPLKSERQIWSAVNSTMARQIYQKTRR